MAFHVGIRDLDGAADDVAGRERAGAPLRSDARGRRGSLARVGAAHAVTSGLAEPLLFGDGTPEEVVAALDAYLDRAL
jgi:hypothetical protein